MHGDFSRRTFDPADAYRAVLLQQGRVLLDADFNEQAEITAHHDEVRTRDIVGPQRRPGPDAAATGVAALGPFAIVEPRRTQPAVRRRPLGRRCGSPPGRYYVDGVLVESPEPATGRPRVAAGATSRTCRHRRSPGPPTRRAGPARRRRATRSTSTSGSGTSPPTRTRPCSSPRSAAPTPPPGLADRLAGARCVPVADGRCASRCSDLHAAGPAPPEPRGWPPRWPRPTARRTRARSPRRAATSGWRTSSTGCRCTRAHRRVGTRRDVPVVAGQRQRRGRAARRLDVVDAATDGVAHPRPARPRRGAVLRGRAARRGDQHRPRAARPARASSGRTAPGPLRTRGASSTLSLPVTWLRPAPRRARGAGPGADRAPLGGRRRARHDRPDRRWRAASRSASPPAGGRAPVTTG